VPLRFTMTCTMHTKVRLLYEVQLRFLTTWFKTTTLHSHFNYKVKEVAIRNNSTNLRCSCRLVTHIPDPAHATRQDIRRNYKLLLLTTTHEILISLIFKLFNIHSLRHKLGNPCRDSVKRKNSMQTRGSHTTYGQGFAVLLSCIVPLQTR